METGSPRRLARQVPKVGRPARNVTDMAVTPMGHVGPARQRKRGSSKVKTVGTRPVGTCPEFTPSFPSRRTNAVVIPADSSFRTLRGRNPCVFRVSAIPIRPRDLPGTDGVSETSPMCNEGHRARSPNRTLEGPSGAPGRGAAAHRPRPDRLPDQESLLGVFRSWCTPNSVLPHSLEGTRRAVD